MNLTNAEQMELLNPEIKEITVGIKKLRKIKVYPLSMADQLELTNILADSIGNLMTIKEESNWKIISFIKDVLIKNLGKILAFITDEGEKLTKELSNSQTIALAEIIYEVNYGILEKKMINFLPKILRIFQSQPLLRESLEATPNTDSKISSEEVSEKEESL